MIDLKNKAESDKSFLLCAIPNADALADILREKRVARVTVTGWGISLSDALLVLKVFRDLGVTLRFS